MAEGLRKSSRSVKSRREPDFIYEDDIINILDIGEDQHSNSGGLQEDSVFGCEDFINGKNTPDSIDWSDIYSIPLADNIKDNALLFNDSPLSPEGSSSQSQFRYLDNNQLIRQESVYIHSEPRTAVSRHNSSTRLDFLEIEPFLSVSPAVYTDKSESQSDMEDLCVCDSGMVAKECCSKGANGGVTGGLDTKAVEALWAAVNQMNELSKEVKGLKVQMNLQDEVIKELKASSGKERSSGSSSDPRGTKGRTKVGKSKAERSKEEKERQYRLLQERLKDKGEESSESGGDNEESEDELNLRELKKKLSKKKKNKCKKREAELLRKAGAMFPEEDYVATSSSGTDSDSVRKSCGHKKKVKSGAKMSKRPVVRTELWPHTVANEEDGEEVACDNINLAKFYSCFTYIMLECRGTELKGRTTLLHAISLVLESLFWSEARTFHNLTMVKIEQGNLEWSDDFTALAESFIDKKVRGSFKSRSAAGNSSAGKTGWYGKGNSNYIKKGGYGYSSNSKFKGKSKPVYNSVCKQWNFQTCTYGDRCNRWHVCWTCAEAGKVGQEHKASSHEAASTRPRQPEQRP